MNGFFKTIIAGFTAKKIRRRLSYNNYNICNHLLVVGEILEQQIQFEICTSV